MHVHVTLANHTLRYARSGHKTVVLAMQLEKLNLIFCKIVGESGAFHRVVEKTNLGIGLDTSQKTNSKRRYMRSLERIEYNVSRDRLILSVYTPTGFFYAYTDSPIVVNYIAYPHIGIVNRCRLSRRSEKKG